MTLLGSPWVCVYERDTDPPLPEELNLLGDKCFECEGLGSVLVSLWNGPERDQCPDCHGGIVYEDGAL